MPLVSFHFHSMATRLFSTTLSQRKSHSLAYLQQQQQQQWSCLSVRAGPRILEQRIGLRVAMGYYYNGRYGNGESWQRREVIGQALLALSSGFALPVLASTGTDAASAFTVFEDASDKFTLMVPQDWTKGEGLTSGQRKVTAFYPADGGLTNVNVVITGLGADFTALGSFGTADNFAENLVNSLDRSWQKPPGQKARLVSSRSKGDKYYVEYTLQRPGEKQRHLVSVVGIASNGWVNRLYTVTGQYYEDDADKYKANVDKVISSFNFL